MKNGTQVFGLRKARLHRPAMHTRAHRLVHIGGRTLVPVDQPASPSHWVATFAHISPAGVVTTGGYFSDPSNTIIRRLLFPLADCPAVSAAAQR